LPAIEAVTFDYWNTLVYEHPGHLKGRRLDAWLGILEDTGVACERQKLDAAFQSTWDAYVASWQANEQYRAAEAAEAIVEGLGFQVPGELRHALVEAFVEAGRGADLHLVDHVETCLQRLKAAGVRLGIVCDVGWTASPILREHLARHGVLDLFDHWSFSDEVGRYKPSAVIFEHALTGLGGVAPEVAAHVGDLRRTDIAGARAIGMTSVRFTGVFDDDTQPEPEGHLVLASHIDLPGALGLD
jgi:putative hydrolase of the HAD superfamily